MPTSTATVRSASTVSANVASPDRDVGVRLLAAARGISPPLAHVPGDHEQDRRQHRQRHVGRERRREQQHAEQRQRRGACRPPASARPSGCWWRCGRWRRSPAARRTSATRCWRRPGRTARCWGCADRRPCDRPPPPTAATRSRPAWPPSTPARSALRISAGRNSGMWNAGRPAGMPPKREPIVATSRLAQHREAGAAEQRDDVAGDPLAGSGSRARSSASERGAEAEAAATTPSARCAPITSSRADELARHARCSRPRKSLSWVLAITSAMPLVKPMMTGLRDVLDRRARAGEPHHHQHHAGHQRAHEQAVDAVLATMPETTTTNAPVGPPIWKRDPPRAEMMKPVTMRAVDAGLRA